MKHKYTVLNLIFIFITMRLLFAPLCYFAEETSFLWFLNGKKNANPDAEILVLGDSQVLSGLTSELISELNSIDSTKILFRVRPSEQPEGMLDQFLELKSNLPNLKKIYLNLSPISISQNAVTDAHKELYFGFANFHLYQITEPSLRSFYFHHFQDLIWKLVIELFPFFGLNQNFSSIFAISSQPTKLIEVGEAEQGRLLRNRSIEIMKERYQNNLFIESHFVNSEHWTWKNFGSEKNHQTTASLPAGSSIAFLKERKGALNAIRRLIEMAKQNNISVVCLDLPFSPALESDMRNLDVRFTLDNEIPSLNFSRVIKIGSENLNKPEYFTDFTHLNAKGRDALKSIVLKK